MTDDEQRTPADPQEAESPPEAAEDAEKPQAGADEAEQASEAEQAEDDGDPAIAKLRKEAAGYRRKLREAEAERDAVRLRLDALESREVERRAGEVLADPADVWRSGLTVDELRDDEGGLDPEKVREAVKRVAADHPHWRVVEPVNYDGGVRESAVEHEPDFAKALREAAGG